MNDTNDTININYKAFNNDWTCRGFQYKLRTKYSSTNKPSICNSGFHACKYPLDVLKYYSPSDSKFALVNQYGDMDYADSDSKVASEHIDIIDEIKPTGLIRRAITYAIEHDTLIDEDKYNYPHVSIARERYVENANYTIAAPAYIQPASSIAVSTLDFCASMAVGADSAAITGGTYSIAATTDADSISIATNAYSTSIAEGARGIAISTGFTSSAEVADKDSVAIVRGYGSKAKGVIGSHLIFIVGKDNTTKVTTILVGKDGIKENTWYVITHTGEVKEGKRQ